MKDKYSKETLLKSLEALANPHRLKIIAILATGRQYVSELARNLEISRPLLYLHLQKLEEVNLVKSNLEISTSGKALKFYELSSFQIQLDKNVIYELFQQELKDNLKGDF